MRHLHRLLTSLSIEVTPEWRSRSRSSSRINSTETSTASVWVCGDRVRDRGSTFQHPMIHGWLPHESARAHTSKVVLSLTPKSWCHLEEQQVLDQPSGRGMDRQFDLLLHTHLFATRTPIAQGDSFDVDAVEQHPPIAAVPCRMGVHHHAGMVPDFSSLSTCFFWGVEVSVIPVQLLQPHLVDWIVR